MKVKYIEGVSRQWN